MFWTLQKDNAMEQLYGKYRKDGFFVLDLSKIPKNEISISPNKSIAKELRELSLLASKNSEYSEKEHHKQHGDNLILFQNTVNHILAAVKTLKNNSQSDIDKAIYLKTEAKLSNIAQSVSGEKSRYDSWIKQDNIQFAMVSAKHFHNSIKSLANELDEYSYEIEALPEKTKTANNNAGNQIPTLDADELKVLNFLNDIHPEIKTQADIEQATGITRKTISKTILPVLKQYNLAGNPPNKKTGVIITQTGLEYIENHFS